MEMHWLDAALLHCLTSSRVHFPVDVGRPVSVNSLVGATELGVTSGTVGSLDGNKVGILAVNVGSTLRNPGDSSVGGNVGKEELGTKVDGKILLGRLGASDCGARWLGSSALGAVGATGESIEGACVQILGSGRGEIVGSCNGSKGDIGSLPPLGD